jgi:hypothetical protein
MLLNFFMFKRSQLKRSKNDVSLIETFKIVSMSMWFESWFRFERDLQIKIRSLRFFVVKHKSMIDSDFWKWKYVDVSFERLNCNRNSFIMSSISNDLMFDRVETSSHDEWWMLKSFIMMWSLICSFNDDFKTKRRFCKAEDDKMFNSLYTLCKCR